MSNRAAIAAAMLAALLFLPTSAKALEIGLQDDQAVVYNWHDRDGMLAQFKAMGGTHIRINVLHARGDAHGLSDHATLDTYKTAVHTVRSYGLTSQLTLVWYQQNSPGKIAAWMGEMAREFAPTVHRYSVLNEPELTLPAANTCDPRDIRRLVASGALKSLRRKITKRKRYRGKVRHVGKRHYGRVRGKRVRVYRIKARKKRAGNRARRGWYRRVTRYRQIRINNPAYPTTQRQLRGGCLKIMRGRMYGRITRQAVPAIRRGDPGAQVLVGETSSWADATFIDAVGNSGGDAWAHHPYDYRPLLNGVGYIRRVSGLPVYATEFGVPADQGHRLAASWRKHADEGARQIVHYQWFTPFGSSSWDTSVHTVGGSSVLQQAIRASRP